MTGKTLKHIAFGEGKVTTITDNKIYAKFGEEEKVFKFPDAFERFLSTADPELTELVNASLLKKANEKKDNDKKATVVTDKKTATRVDYSYKSTKRHNSSISNSLLGPRSQGIDVDSEYEMFILVGYMAKPNRISSIEAEVPKDGRDLTFEKMFPGQKYRPIELGNTPSGMPNKLSPQFRINFVNLDNCPAKLKANMGKGNAGCAGRINKSKFVLELVMNYGFTFGEHQDIEFIKRNAENKGYIDAYYEGFNK